MEKIVRTGESRWSCRDTHTGRLRPSRRHGWLILRDVPRNSLITVHFYVNMPCHINRVASRISLARKPESFPFNISFRILNARAIKTWKLRYYTIILDVFSVSASLFTLVRLEYRSVMPAGNCTAWNMVSSRTVKCHLIKPSEVATTASILSLARPVLASMSPERYLST